MRYLLTMVLILTSGCAFDVAGLRGTGVVGDAGPMTGDAGPEVDAGSEVDAGPTLVDSGSETDAGQDAGSDVDSGSTEDGGTTGPTCCLPERVMPSPVPCHLFTDGTSDCCDGLLCYGSGGCVLPTGGGGRLGSPCFDGGDGPDGGRLLLCVTATTCNMDTGMCVVDPTNVTLLEC